LQSRRWGVPAVSDQSAELMARTRVQTVTPGPIPALTFERDLDRAQTRRPTSPSRPPGRVWVPIYVPYSCPAQPLRPRSSPNRRKEAGPIAAEHRAPQPQAHDKAGGRDHSHAQRREFTGSGAGAGTTRSRCSTRSLMGQRPLRRSPRSPASSARSSAAWPSRANSRRPNAATVSRYSDGVSPPVRLKRRARTVHHGDLLLIRVVTRGKSPVTSGTRDHR
jgi:hypothetical protein